MRSSPSLRLSTRTPSVAANPIVCEFDARDAFGAELEAGAYWPICLAISAMAEGDPELRRAVVFAADEELRRGRPMDWDELPELLRERVALQRVTPGVDTLLERLFGLVDLLAGRRPFFGRQLAEAFQASSQLALLAKVPHANSVQRPQIGGAGDFGLSLGNQLAQ